MKAQFVHDQRTPNMPGATPAMKVLLRGNSYNQGPSVRTARKVAPSLTQLLAVLLALVPATSGTLRGLVLPGLKLSDILLVIVASVLLLRWRGAWKITDSTGIALALFAFVSVTLTVLNYIERPTLLSEAPLIMEIVSIPQFLLLYLTAFGFAQWEVRPIRIFEYNLAIAAVVSLIAIAQILDIGPVRAVLAALTGNSEIVDPFEWKTYRATGTFASWHALGMYLAVTLSFAIIILLKVPLTLKERNKILALSAVVLGGLLSALTATPILLVATVLVCYGLRKRGLKYIPAFALIGVTLVFITPLGELFSERLDAQLRGTGSTPSWLPQTISYRIAIWQNDYLPIIDKNILTGYGPLGSSDGQVFKFTESMYITLLLAGGLPLLIAFCLFISVAFIKLRGVSAALKGTKTAQPLEALARALALILLFLVVAQFLHPYLVDAGGAQLVYMALGLILGSCHRLSFRARTIGSAA